jgi:hypothetical protein
MAITVTNLDLTVGLELAGLCGDRSPDPTTATDCPGGIEVHPVAVDPGDVLDEESVACSDLLRRRHRTIHGEEALA